MVDVEPTDEGLKSTFGPFTVSVKVRPDNDQLVKIHHDEADDPLLATTYGYGWWDVDNQAGAIRKTVRKKLDDLPTDTGYWDDKWGDLCTTLTEEAESADDEALPRSAEAKKIVENTKNVVVSPGETTEWEVVIEENGRTGTLSFDEKDMGQMSPDRLREEYSRVFYRTPRIEENDEWADIREAWQRMQTTRPAVDFTDEDIIVEQFIDELRARLRFVADPVEIDKGPETAWYDEDNDRDVGTHDGAVIWVKTETIQNARDALIDSISPAKLSKQLRAREFTVATSETRQLEGVKTRFWFFDADALEISEMDVHESDASGSPEVEV
jgi:hypothetical protein